MYSVRRLKINVPMTQGKQEMWFEMRLVNTHVFNSNQHQLPPPNFISKAAWPVPVSQLTSAQ